MNKLWQINTLFLWYWYSCFRWTWLEKDKWLYTPINMTTAFLSIFILTITVSFYYSPVLQARIFLLLQIPSINYVIFLLCSLVMWLAFRNAYYTGEDVVDLRTMILAYLQHQISLNALIQQFLFVIIDLLMLSWCVVWLKSVLAFLNGLK